MKLRRHPILLLLQALLVMMNLAAIGLFIYSPSLDTLLATFAGSGNLLFMLRNNILFTLRDYIPQKRTAKAPQVQDDLQSPQLAEYLLYVFLTKTERKSMLGDLEEEYHIVASRFGKRKAHFWYYSQVVWSLGPLAVRAVKKLIKWGVLGWIGDLVRRVIS